MGTLVDGSSDRLLRTARFCQDSGLFSFFDQPFDRIFISSVRPADVCIVGVARTPMGGLLGSLSSLSATQLGSIAIKCSCPEPLPPLSCDHLQNHQLCLCICLPFRCPQEGKCRSIACAGSFLWKRSQCKSRASSCQAGCFGSWHS